MNYNIDRKQVALFRKLARKNETVIKRMRSVYRDAIRENYLMNGSTKSYSNRIAKQYANKISIRKLLNFWEDYHDADANIFPMNAVKRFSDKEKITLDID